jgi:3-hydroxyisobutyrate dehydrogenase-like beta-hydroxyacid dehydrogenase
MNEIGFIGLGNVGLPAALNLLRAGFSVRGYDVRPNQQFEAAGGKSVPYCHDVASAPVIVQSLPSVAALASSVDSLTVEPHAGQIVIELSSYPIAAKQAQADRLADYGIEMLDCEISGLAHQIASRSGVIFKAGNVATVDSVKPVFDAIAERHYYLGAFGAASKMKLIANTMVCVHNLMAAEALALGKQIGLDPEQMLEVLGNSAAGSMTFRNKGPLMVSRDFADGSGPFRHMFGYLSRTRDIANDAGSATPLLEAASKIFAIAEAEGRHDQDIAAIIEVVEALQRKDAACSS